MYDFMSETHIKTFISSGTFVGFQSQYGFKLWWAKKYVMISVDGCFYKRCFGGNLNMYIRNMYKFDSNVLQNC